MRNRTTVKPLLLVVVVVVTIFWMLRRESSPSSLSTPPSLAESSEARVGPGDIYPNPLYTPGATNLDIEQDNIRETICNPRWSTKSIRPPTTYTNHLKVEQILEYGYADTNRSDYEEDHLIPLELGGSPTDPKNLWPEPRSGDFPASRKDGVENSLHARGCAGLTTLAAAQAAIATNWESA